MSTTNHECDGIVESAWIESAERTGGSATPFPNYRAALREPDSGAVRIKFNPALLARLAAAIGAEDAIELELGATSVDAILVSGGRGRGALMPIAPPRDEKPQVIPRADREEALHSALLKARERIAELERARSEEAPK